MVVPAIKTYDRHPEVLAPFGASLEGRRPVPCRLRACCAASAVHPSWRGFAAHLRMTGLG
jgi:hypothetical protein